VSKLMTSIGLMSGTSLDGIDVAMIRTDGESIVERGPAQTFAYSDQQRDVLRQALDAARLATDRSDRTGVLGDTEMSVTSWHEAAVREYVSKFSLNLSNIDIIGVHGQTVLHRPERRLTMQLGDGPKLASQLGVMVAYDLRAADVLAGGQGAPLVPVYHRALAAGLLQRPVVFVNIGGVANVTYVDGDTLIAFDTGPGNALVDDWMMRKVGRARDEGGQIALSGKIDEQIVADFLSDSFFTRPGPKSLDRNSFATTAIAALSLEDGAATLVAITTRAIGQSRKYFPAEPALWVVCGGGRHNQAIMLSLRQLLPTVKSAEDCGFDGDAMEAEAWAYLAVRSLKGLPLTYPGTTGVDVPLTGGIIANPTSVKHGHQ
jgi:anhydro-N-acetylmuramic acid kinase